MKRFVVVCVAIMTSMAVSADMVTAERATNAQFVEHEKVLLGVTRAPNAPAAVPWNVWTSGGVENFAVKRGGKLVCLLSFRLGEPMLMDATFKPAHHRWLVGVLIVSESFTLGSAQLDPGAYGAWLEGQGTNADSESTTFVLRNAAGQETIIPLGNPVHLLQPNTYSVDANSDGATLRVNNVALAIGGDA
jgi:hypothetical protein